MNQLCGSQRWHFESGKVRLSVCPGCKMRRFNSLFTRCSRRLSLLYSRLRQLGGHFLRPTQLLVAGILRHFCHHAQVSQAGRMDQQLGSALYYQAHFPGCSSPESTVMSFSSAPSSCTVRSDMYTNVLCVCAYSELSSTVICPDKTLYGLCYRGTGVPTMGRKQ
jgi:hypothetical protein